MATSSSQSFDDLMRRYRLVAGPMQEDLADLAGLSARGVSDLERGTRRPCAVYLDYPFQD